MGRVAILMGKVGVFMGRVAIVHMGDFSLPKRKSKRPAAVNPSTKR
jgi:hypothetical protein